MAIEGNDWWWIAGAAAAGGVIGGVAVKRSSPDLYFTGYRRWYIRSIPESHGQFKKVMFDVLLHRAMATVWFDEEMNPTIRIYEWVEPKKTALTQEVQFLPLIHGGAPFEKELTDFIDTDEAIKMTDAYMEDHEMVPAGEWGFIGGPPYFAPMGTKGSMTKK